MSSALMLSGCTAHSAGSSVVSFTHGSLEERESAAVYQWIKLGTEAGEVVRAYCLFASPRERAALLDTLTHHASPARVTITCP